MILNFEHQIQVYSLKPYWFQIKILPLLTLKWHILTVDHSYTMLFEGGTPLNNPPIEIHTNSSMFALIFWPHVTIFCILWLHECLKWILEFNSKSLFWCQSRQIFEVRAIEQRHHEFELIHMPLHQFWPRYHSDGLSPVHVRFEIFSKHICNVDALIFHFIKTSKLSRKFISLGTLIYFVHALFFTGTIRGCTKCGRI